MIGTNYYILIRNPPTTWSSFRIVKILHHLRYTYLLLAIINRLLNRYIQGKFTAIDKLRPP